MIILFNSFTLQRDCYFVEEFFSFERRFNNDQNQRSTTEEKQETETNSVEKTFTGIRTVPFSQQDLFCCVSDSCFTVIPECFSYHLHRIFRFP